MARKGKKKKGNKSKKIKKDFNKKEFCEIFCPNCGVCSNEQPNFCYSFLYKSFPKAFVNKVYNNLVDLHVAYNAMGRSMKVLSVEQFQNAVCRTGICHSGDVYASALCDRAETCYQELIKQMGVHRISLIHESDVSNLISFKNTKTNKSPLSYRKKNKKDKKKRKQRYVCAAYPTFFSSPNAKFQAIIRKIIYGDIDNQQDKDQAVPSCDSGTAGGQAKSGQS